MTVKAKTVYTKKMALKFTRFNSVRKTGQIVTYVVMELVMLALAAFSVYMAVNGDSEDMIAGVIIAVISPFVVPAVVFVLPFFVVRSNGAAIDAVVEYCFSENHVTIDATMKALSGQTNADFKSFEHVYETKDCFYFYVSKLQCYILDKASIYEGSVADLQRLLRTGVPAARYTVKGGAAT